MVGDIHSRLYAGRSKLVNITERKINFGIWRELKGFVGDEVDLGKNEDVETPATSKTPIVWEIWGGIVEPGAPETLVLFRLEPKNTRRRVPWPGPIRKTYC